MSRLTAETRRIWTIPIVIALATMISLVGALVVDGVWDWLASLILFGVLAYSTFLGLRTYERR